MSNKTSTLFYTLGANNTLEEKMALINKVMPQLITHFHKKAGQSKQLYVYYKYSSIVFAALTTIIASLQVIYPATFPQWILPVVSALATISVAFLGTINLDKLQNNAAAFAN